MGGQEVPFLSLPHAYEGERGSALLRMAGRVYVVDCGIAVSYFR